MAAHALTGIREAIEMTMRAQRREMFGQTNDDYWSSMNAAVDISCWTEDIGIAGLDLYQAVKDGTLDKVEDVLVATLPTIKEEWRRRGQPSCREEWHGLLDAG